MGAFFNSWQLWEKMCFVLAAAIVFVIFIGCGKVMYNHWRLRKYTKLAAVKAQHRQAIEQRPSVRARKGREVPFGVRAIESGIEVDGVWISRSNTPGQSTTGSPAPSIMLETSAMKHSQSPERASALPKQQALEVPQPAHGHSTSSQSRHSTPSQHSGPFQDRLAESEQLPRSSTTSDYMPRARPTYQPKRSSGLRFSNSHDNSSALAALEGRRMASTPEVPGSEDSHSSSNSSEENYVPRRSDIKRDSSDILFDRSYLPSGMPRNPNSDYLNALASHHRSHAAEGKSTAYLFAIASSTIEGQLLSRTRLSGSGTNYNQDLSPEHRYMTEAARANRDTSDPFATPAGTPLGSPSITHMEDPPSFASFVNSRSISDNQIEALDDDNQSHSYYEKSNKPLQQGDGNRQLRSSQVARKVNSGFEILRPGSFTRPAYNAADWSEKGIVGNEQEPERLANDPEKKRQLKKLQRKRADSKESRFKEEV